MKYTRKIINDYCVLDLETTGLSFDYDEIIEIGILKIRDNKIIDTFSQLVKPHREIDGFITELTGITQEMLNDKPSFHDIKNDVLGFINGDLIVGHNTYFDKNFLENGVGHELDNEYIDTLQFSRKIYPELKSHRLEDMVNFLSLSSNEHRALEDCISTKELYDCIKKEMDQKNLKISDLFIKHNSKIDIDKMKPDTDYIDEENFFYNKHCVFSGKLEKLLRKEAMQLVINAGGILDKSVTKSTNFLILGNNDYCSLIKDGKSSKQKKAEALKLQGQDIETIDENTFYKLINYDINNK